jgi:hypothetical protein
MIKHNQDGAVSGVVISLVLAVLLLLGAIGFGAWAYTSRQDYKDHSDAKVNTAVQAAKTQEAAVKDAQFVQDYKKPLTTYSGPEALGSLVINFPKTWSGYVDTTGSNGQAFDAYFAPGVVPALNSPSSVFALHVYVSNQPYSQVLQTFASQQKAGKLTVSAYSLPKLPKIVGVKVSGVVSGQTQATIIILPLRSQTLQIATLGTQYLADFNNNILPNFSFSP